jgi:hypothetical protein
MLRPLTMLGPGPWKDRFKFQGRWNLASAPPLPSSRALGSWRRRPPAKFQGPWNLASATPLQVPRPLEPQFLHRDPLSNPFKFQGAWNLVSATPIQVPRPLELGVGDPLPSSKPLGTWPRRPPFQVPGPLELGPAALPSRWVASEIDSRIEPFSDQSHHTTRRNFATLSPRRFKLKTAGVVDRARRGTPNTRKCHSGSKVSVLKHHSSVFSFTFSYLHHHDIPSNFSYTTP